MAQKKRDRQHRGYQYPIPIDGYPMIDVCFQIPDHQRYRAAVRGQLTQLYNFYMWYNDDNDDLQQRWDVARQFTNSLTDTLQFGEGCAPVDQLQVRTNLSNPCILEYSPDGGLNWFEFANTADCLVDGGNSYYTQVNINLLQTEIYLLKYVAPDQRTININAPLIIFDGDDSGTPTFFREEALCMAAQIYVGSYAGQKVQALDVAFIGLSLLLVAITWITGGIGILAGIAIGGSSLTIGINWFVARAALLDKIALQAVACCMDSALQGQNVNQANFQASLDSCGFTAGTNEAIVRDLVEVSLSELTSYLAFIDALGREYIAASVFGVNDCNCTLGTFIHTFDFTIDDGGWVNRAVDNRPYGVWQSGVGWVSVWGGASEGINDDIRLYIMRDGWVTRFITRIELFFTSTGVQGGPNRRQTLQLLLNGTPGNNKDFGGYIVPDTWMETTDPFEQANEINTANTGDSSADNMTLVCTKIVVYGNGSDPF